MSSHQPGPGTEKDGASSAQIAIAIAGGAAALVVALVLLAQHVASVGSAGNADMSPEAVARRIAPVALLVFDNAPAAPASAPAKAPGPAPAATAAAPAKAADGKATYTQICSVCHATALAGAPKFGDKAAWAPRVAQGSATLHDHAIKGFQGKAGMMPPKGGNGALSDADVMAAVDYMVSQAK
jgi:cytochrome c5